MPRHIASRWMLLIVSALGLAASAAALARQQSRTVQPDGREAAGLSNEDMPPPAAPSGSIDELIDRMRAEREKDRREDWPIDAEDERAGGPQAPMYDPEAEKAIKPLPLVAIPDDPPPHEGAMLSIPYIINPPDVIRIEVLQALPGRPIGGDRLVRPDGKVNLDFYGEIEVAGLTVEQVKEKVIQHLRRYLIDDVLGLLEFEEDGRHKLDENGDLIHIPPAESNCVFVDVASYNSAVYYVQGDVGIPGKFPCTAGDTILDAYNYAGGFAPTAEESDIHLARPARGGKPAKVFTIDLPAIRDRADSAANLQLFPGDRLIVGRNPVVKATVELNRLAEPTRLMVNDILTYATMTKVLSTANGGAPMTAAQREAFLKEWLDSWAKNALAPGGPKLDEEAIRKLLLRHFDDPKAAPEAPPASK